MINIVYAYILRMQIKYIYLETKSKKYLKPPHARKSLGGDPTNLRASTS